MEKEQPTQSGEKEEKVDKKRTDIDRERVKQDVENEKPLKMLAAFSFVFFMICIGVPLWWKTTQVYRAHVPYSDITTLVDTHVPLPVSIQFISSNENTKFVAESVKKDLEQKLTQNIFHDKINFNLQIRILEASHDVNKIVTSVGSVEELDGLISGLPRQEEDFALSFLLVPGNSVVFGPDIGVYFGNGKTVFVKMSEPQIVSGLIEEALMGVYLNKERILEIVRRNLKERLPPSENSRKNVWGGSFHPFQALDFYLINPDPDVCNTRQLNMEMITETQLKHFYDLLEPITSLAIKSQNLYYVDLPHKPTFDADREAFRLESRHLPHLMNPMEGYVTSLEPDRAVFNILLYLTPPKYHPLMILDEKGDPTKYNSFIIAGWGGVTVVNHPGKCNTSITELPIGTLESIVGQLRSLFGLGSGVLPLGISKSPSPLARWEVQRQIIHATMENVLNAVTTLESLTNLLEQIKNIVINDEVGSSIENAVLQLELAFVALNKGEFPSALEHSKVGLLDAEKAFFDPSLLALLYFPDDQKYAIYIPLFLPVGLPVIFSLRHIYRHVRERRNLKSKTD